MEYISAVLKLCLWCGIYACRHRHWPVYLLPPLTALPPSLTRPSAKVTSLNFFIGTIISRPQLDMVTKHLQKSSPKQVPKKKPVTQNANGTQQCSHCHQPAPVDAASPGRSPAHSEERHQPDGSSGSTGPLVLTLGSAADRRSHCCCSCGVAPAMTSVLRGSRYLRPAQELLREAVSMGEAGDANAGGNDEAKKHGQLEASALQEMYLQAATNCPFHGRDNDRGGVQTKLLSLLSELESRHEHYFRELSRVASSFEPALGAGTTAGYTSLVAQAMSRHFGNLRRAILRKLRLHAAAAARRSASTLREDEEGEDDYDDDEEAALPVTEDMVHKVVRRKKQTAAARAEQVWRPLRGLPEDSVAVLRAWLFDHFLHPYPNDNEKLRLAVSTGLSRSQISNWFINARVRLWKPMIEEMYNDEFSEDSFSVSRDDMSGGASSSS